MFKLIASLLSLLDNLFRAYREDSLKQQGRNEAQEVSDANVAKAEAAIATPDPERDERLRNRFDRSKLSK